MLLETRLWVQKQLLGFHKYDGSVQTLEIDTSGLFRREQRSKLINNKGESIKETKHAEQTQLLKENHES